MARLDDFYVRLGWADSDGKSVERLINEFIATNPYTIHIEPYGDRWKATFERLIDPAQEAEWLERIARPFGSYLDNVRAALNYMAYQFALVAVQENPTLQGSLNVEAVEFPIFNCGKLYRRKNRIKKFPDKYRAPIEDIQPYKGGHDDLWVLHHLAAKFRHHLVHPVAVWAPEDFQGIRAVGARDIETVSHGPLKHGDVVITFIADADVDPGVAIAVGIDDPLCADRGCAAVLTDITNDVASVIEPLIGLLPDA